MIILKRARKYITQCIIINAALPHLIKTYFNYNQIEYIKIRDNSFTHYRNDTTKYSFYYRMVDWTNNYDGRGKIYLFAVRVWYQNVHLYDIKIDQDNIIHALLYVAHSACYRYDTIIHGKNIYRCIKKYDLLPNAVHSRRLSDEEIGRRYQRFSI